MNEQAHTLIVDDDADLREAMAMLLEDEGLPSVTAANGQEALDRLRSSAPLPNLILLDISMPVMNGIEFRAHQLADPRLASIPVVLLSASGRVAAEAPKLRILETLPKPFRPDALIAVVRRHCLHRG